MKRFRNILFVVETEDDYRPALDRAVVLARNNQARITLVNVLPLVRGGIGIPDEGPLADELQADMLRTYQEDLQGLVAQHGEGIDMHSKVLAGVPFMEIIREVIAGEYDLVIKIPDAPDWLDRLFSSDDMHLLRKCPCPVWLVRAGAPKAYRRILAAVDAGGDYPDQELRARAALNEQVLQMAISQALSDFAELHVVHVWDAIGESAMRGAFMRTAEEKISAYIKQVKQQHEERLHALIDGVARTMGKDTLDYVKPQTHLIRGLARREVATLAKRIDADLVVMGTVGRTGIPGFFMGNTAETILNQIDCSVLAVKPPGFQTPVTLEDA